MKSMIPGLQSIELAVHNFSMALPQHGSSLFAQLNIPEWEIQAASHFVSRIAEAAKRSRTEIERRLDHEENERKKNAKT